MLPIEKNARRLVGVLVQHFPRGGICEDLRRQFEKDTSLARQSFYNALSYAKNQGWIVGGARDQRDQYQLYNLNPDGSWKEPATESIGEGLEKDRLEYLVDSQTRQLEGLQSEVERLRDWSSGSDTNGANVALSTLARIVGDSTASTRQRIRAAAAVLGYKTQGDLAVDYKIEAGELLRKHEAPRVTPESVRPAYRDGPGAETERVEAWRSYTIKQRQWKLAIETRDVPHWSQWAADLYADDYIPPPGWPPW